MTELDKLRAEALALREQATALNNTPTLTEEDSDKVWLVNIRRHKANADYWEALEQRHAAENTSLVVDLANVLYDWLANAESGFLDEIPRHQPDVYQNQLVADTVNVLARFEQG